VAEAVKRGPAAGRRNVERLLAYIDQIDAMGGTLPSAKGALNHSAICEAVGVARSVVHQNPSFRAVLEAYAAEHGLAFSSRATTAQTERQTGNDEGNGRPYKAEDDRRIRDLERQISRLEKRVATLVAETVALRAEGKRAECTEDDMILRGGRYVPGAT